MGMYDNKVRLEQRVTKAKNCNAEITACIAEAEFFGNFDTRTNNGMRYADIIAHSNLGSSWRTYAHYA